MTLVVAMKAQDGIILAADSRGTVGDPRGLTAITDDQEKIFSLGSCGIAFAGASEVGAALLDEWKKKKLDGPKDVEEAVTTLVPESADCFARWYRDIPAEKRPGVVMTLAGFRDTGKGSEAMIYLMTSNTNFAPSLFGNNPCLSGVPQYAVYLRNRYYDPSISLTQARHLAEYLISETASQDPKVGGPIRMAEITPKTGYNELTPEEVAEVQKANQKLNADMRQFFLKGAAS